MTVKSTENKPAAVPVAKQAGETLTKWWWVEPEIWTERMLAALETGVKGGKWFSLIDKVFSHQNLHRAFQKVKKNQGAAGTDHQTIAEFDSNLEEEIKALAQELREGTYQPRLIRRHYIPKPGSKELRPLGIPCVRDRTVQTVIRSIIEPIFEIGFAEQSYGFRPGRGCKNAPRQVDSLLKQGYLWVVDIDLKSYFDTIPHAELMSLVEQQISDGRMLKLIDSFLKQGVLEGLKEWEPEKGTPQGAVVSPLLSNIYLDPLDHLMNKNGFEMVRYADDAVILCKSQEEAFRAFQLLQEWVNNAKLILHPEKTRILDASQPGGFDFLGYHFERGWKKPRKKSLQKFKDSIRRGTKRTNGNSLKTIVEDLNPRIRGWFGYFKHCTVWVFKELDGWIRRRFRSILRKRQKKKGISKGGENQRWPNSFFQEIGLYSLETAHVKACQS